MNSSVRATYWGPNTQFGVVAFPEQRALAEQRGWKVDGQEETCPTTGKKHYQFWVKTPQVRMSEVKKVFQGAHIEVARNVKAVQNYCAKEETRSGVLPQASDKYPSQDKLFDLFSLWMNKTMRGYPKYSWGRKYPGNCDEWLLRFDECCEDLIRDGYRVESLAVNPAVRSCIKKFGSAIYYRHISAKSDEEVDDRCAVDRQTDRQAEKISLPVCTNIDATVHTRDDSEERSPDDSSQSASQDFEDDFCSADERDSQGTGADGSEASHSTCDSQ